MRRVFVLAVLLFSMVAASDDSKRPVSENPPIVIPLTKSPKIKKTKVKKLELVILDVRPYFEFTLNHAETAQPVRIQDFSMAESDFSMMASKLRSLGVGPETDVLIIGAGKKGEGEEGRMAWLLKYLGLSKVKIVDFESYKGRKNSYDRKDNLAAPFWIPKIKEDIRIKKDKLRNIETEKNIVFIDTRTTEEFSKEHIPGAISIFWKNILESKDIKKLLRESGADLAKSIVFYDTGGMGAAYATFVALEAGLNAKFYDGGMDEWKSSK